MTALSEILLIIILNIWSRKSYEQGFYFEPVDFKAAVNIFELMEISESIYEGVVEPSYKEY